MYDFPCKCEWTGASNSVGRSPTINSSSRKEDKQRFNIIPSPSGAKEEKNFTSVSSHAGSKMPIVNCFFTLLPAEKPSRECVIPNVSADFFGYNLLSHWPFSSTSSYAMTFDAIAGFGSGSPGFFGNHLPPHTNFFNPSSPISLDFIGGSGSPGFFGNHEPFHSFVFGSSLSEMIHSIEMMFAHSICAYRRLLT